jgi:hypothetical protein
MASSSSDSSNLSTESETS